MLKNFIKVPARRYLFLTITQAFSIVSDPYYILGVDKSAEFSQIKKAFYKLANQYHPDKKDDNDSKKKFLAIKEAFESIKIQKGISKPNKGYQYQESTESMRPNPTQFETSDDEFYQKNRDYRIFDEKAQAAGDEYQRFRGTFKTLNDINEIKIRVEKGEMKDAASRFNLEAFRAKNVRRSENSPTLVYVFAFGTLAFGLLLIGSLTGAEKASIELKLEKEQTKQKQRRIYQSESEKSKKVILKQMQKNEQLQKIMSSKFSGGVFKSREHKKNEEIGQDFASV